MRFVWLLAAAPFVACKKYRRPVVEATVEEPGELASKISMGNPNDESQLLNGFYGVESKSWRWTAKKFAVSLHPPPAGRLMGLKLELDCAVADAIASQLLPLTVGAKVGGVALDTQKLTKAGRQMVLFAVPKQALNEDAVVVEFELDKVAKMGDESRELGLIVVGAGFVEP